jgi:phage terminase Nu1 subunit (DNA packaging protein)
MAHRLKTKEVCAVYGIDWRTLMLWISDGCPIARRGKGRRPHEFDHKKLAAWVEANGRRTDGARGEAVRTVPEDNPKPDADDMIKRVGMDGYVARCRQQERGLFGKYIRLVQSDAPGNEIGSISRALSVKGEELRRAEMAYLEHQKQTGDLVNLADASRLFSELASGVQQRMMSLPNQLVPLLRQYLRDEADGGRVRDVIDQEIRRALTSLPEKMPEVKK